MSLALQLLIILSCILSGTLLLLPVFFRRIEGVAQAVVQGMGLGFFLLSFFLFALWLVM